MKNNEELANEWLKRAISSYHKAISASSDNSVYYEDLCFDLQQAIEKALKALLILHDKDFPKTHSLAILIDLLSELNIIIPNAEDIVEEISKYAVSTEYPGDYDPITKEDFQKANELTEKLIAFAKSEMNIDRLF